MTFECKYIPVGAYSLFVQYRSISKRGILFCVKVPTENLINRLRKAYKKIVLTYSGALCYMLWE